MNVQNQCCWFFTPSWVFMSIWPLFLIFWTMLQLFVIVNYSLTKAWNKLVYLLAETYNFLRNESFTIFKVLKLYVHYQSGLSPFFKYSKSFNFLKTQNWNIVAFNSTLFLRLNLDSGYYVYGSAKLPDRLATHGCLWFDKFSTWISGLYVQICLVYLPTRSEIHSSHSNSQEFHWQTTLI